MTNKIAFENLDFKLVNDLYINSVYFITKSKSVIFRVYINDIITFSGEVIKRRNKPAIDPKDFFKISVTMERCPIIDYESKLKIQKLLIELYKHKQPPKG